MSDTLPASAVESWNALIRRAPRILLVSFLIALASYTVAAKMPVSYNVHFSYVVSQEAKEVPPGFRYDGYYALSASDLFTATLASWIAQPQTIVAAYEASSMPLPTQDAVDLGKYIHAEKAAPGLVNITVENPSQETAEAVAGGIAKIVPVFIAQQNTVGTPAVTFRAISSRPWTGTSRIAPLPIALVFFMFAFLAQIIGVLLLK